MQRVPSWLLGSLAIVLVPVPTSAFAQKPLSIEQAIELALANNPAFIIVKQDVESAAAQIDFESGAFAPRLSAGVTLSYIKSPGSPISVESKDKQLLADIALGGRWRSGLTYGLRLTTQIDELTPAVTYSPFFATGLELELAQPLLRDAWFRVNEAGIEIATRRKDASEHLRRAQVERILADVELAYWALVLARNKLDIRRVAVRLAEQQVELSKKRLKHGAIAAIDAIEAESEVARAKEQIPSTEQQVVEAEGALNALLLPAGPTTDLAAGFVLTSLPETLPSLGTLDEYLAAAESRRPDLAAARADVEAALVAAEVAQNRLLPALDVVVSAGLGGISGTFGGTRASPDNPDPDLEGGYFGALENFRFPQVAAGLRFEIPLDNAQAEAQQRIQDADVVRRKALVDALRIQVRNEVTTAFKRLAADLDLVKASNETVKLAEKFLEGQKKLFNEGVGVSFDVFRATSALTRARVAQVRAQVRARISEARLSFVQGLYLESHHVKLDAAK